MKKLAKYTVGIADTPEDVRQTDLVKLSSALLRATVDSTGYLNMSKMTEEKLKEAKVILGFVNATNSVIKTKMQVFKMLGLDEKVAVVKKASEKL